MKMKNIMLYFFASFILIVLLTASSSKEIYDRQHCYALISPIEEGNYQFSRIIKSECFNTFKDSIYAATTGRIKLDLSINPEEVTDEMLNYENGLSSINNQVVIGIDWESNNFGGSSNTWVVSGSGCSSSVQYSVSSMPSGWDNRVSSARGYSGCNYYYHFQNTNFGGSFVVCNTECSLMGSLDNATSSEKWRYSP